MLQSVNSLPLNQGLKPGFLLKRQIPIRTHSQWQDETPDFIEIDLLRGLARGEQKNWSVGRRYLGYFRYDTQQALQTMAELEALLGLYVNFFQPSLKLKQKIRNGSKVKKVYDPPRRLTKGCWKATCRRRRNSFSSKNTSNLIRQSCRGKLLLYRTNFIF